MKKKQKKMKKIRLHPISGYLLLIIITIIASFILSLFNLQTTYNVVNSSDLSLNQVTIVIKNMLSFTGLKEIISSAAINFMSFAPLGTFLIASIGLCVCEASGLLKVLFGRVLEKLNGKFITFMIIFIATISTLINDIGYVILIPLAAIIYKSKGKNPLTGICAAFCGVAFASGTTIFIGSIEASIIPYTTSAARLIDSTYHVSLLSNIFIMIMSSIILSIIGTIIIEKIIAPKLGKYQNKKEIEINDNVELIDEPVSEYEQEQHILSNQYNEKRGLRMALISFIVIVIMFIYSVIPNLPFSGLLLDMQEETYLKQIFGNNSYFQDGFTFMISLLFFVPGVFYGFGSRKFKNDKDLINESAKCLGYVGEMIILIFIAAQFISIFKMSNLGTIISSILANFLNSLEFGGIPFLIISFIVMAVANIFLTGTQAKWIIFSPVVVSVLMRSNISPQFSQFLMRASDSVTNGINPLFAYFVIYLGYLNYYNLDKDKPITINKAIKIIIPYFVIITISWLFILLGWYIIGLPIGPNVYPTI